MLPTGVPAKTRLPLVLYKGLLRKAKLFDRYPILKAYCNDPLKRGTLYIPSVSFHAIVRESFRIEEERQFDLSRGFKMYREWADIYASVSKKITWYNQSLPTELSEQKEPVVKHIKNIIPGSVLISHPAMFEKNEGSEIVLVLQRNEYETMALLIQGKNLRADEDESPNSLSLTPQQKANNLFSQMAPAISSEADFAQELKDFDDESIRKVIIVDDSDMDPNSKGGTFAIHKFIIPTSEEKEQDNSEFERGSYRAGIRDDLSDDGYDAYDYESFEGDGYDVEAGEDEYVARAEDEDYDDDYDDDDYDDDYDEGRDLDQIADDGRGKKNNPSVLALPVEDSPKDVPPPQTPKQDFISSKTVYKGGTRFAAKYVVIYNKSNKSKLEGEWLSDNLNFEVFTSKESMKKSKINTLPPHQYRIFQGYHIFPTEQLEKQVADGTYFVCHTPLEILNFDKNLDNPPVLSTEEIWSNILMEMGGEFSHFAHSRKSPMEKVTAE
jgi:putative AlgH/UPF0301 family transcriptional regulator